MTGRSQGSRGAGHSRRNKPAGTSADQSEATRSDAFDPAQVPADVAEYVGQMSGELAALARRAGLGTLAYLLDMAQMEARTTAGKSRSEAEP